MSFPPHDLIQASMTFYRLTGIADQINQAIADTGLKAEVTHTPNLLQYVKVPLEHGGALTVTALTAFPGAWQIGWPVSRTEAATTHWPLETERDVLVQIVAAVVRDGLRGRELPSPFRWGRTEQCRIVDLADELLNRGADRPAVQLEPHIALDQDGRPRSSRGRQSELRLSDKSDPERTLVVRLDPQHGWAVDQVMPFPGASGRLNLASALGLQPSLPRVGPDDVEIDRLAQLLVEDTFWVDVHDDDQRHLALYGEAPAEADVHSKETADWAAIEWLLWAGFADQADRWVRPPRLTPAIELHVDYSETPVGIGAVQRLKGVSAVNNRTPVVVARSRYTKNARDWADRAEMLLFTIDAGGLLHPANALATAYTPSEMGLRPRDCDDPACRTIGCVIEAEHCVDQRGRRSHPDAERWRLF